MRTIFLHGHLGEQFGESFRFEVQTAGEALRALNCAFPGKFVDALREGSYRVVRGDEESGMDLDLELVMKFKLGQGDLHFIPMAAGAKNSGTMKTILGVALIGTAIFFSAGTAAGLGTAAFSIGGMGITWGNIAVLGLGLALAGVAQMISKPNNDQQKNDASYALGGQVNTYEQGSPVPLIYGGPIIVGSQAISAGFDIEQVGAFEP